MAQEDTNGALAGAAQGAAAGAVFGPWGAVIGAVVGGVIGAFSGDAKRAAKKYGAMAADVRREQQTMKLALQRRDTVRSLRIQRAQAVAAGASEQGVQSSSVGGAVGSIDSQGASGVRYFDTQVALDNQFQELAKKAGKYAGEAADLDAVLASAGSLSKVGADIYGSTKTPPSNGYSTISGPKPGGQSSYTPATTYPYQFQTYGQGVPLS